MIKAMKPVLKSVLTSAAKPALAVAIAWLAAGGALAAAPLVGAEAAGRPKTAEAEAARRVVLPEAACGVFVKTVHVVAAVETLVYYKGYSKPDTSDLVGYCVTARGRGYSSTIETVVGLDLAGRITGTRIVSQTETPGIGNKIVEVKAAKTAIAALAALPAEAAARRRVVLAPEGALAGVGCLVVAVKDAAALAGLEKALGAGDTAAVVENARKALAFAATRASVLEDRAVLFAASSKAVAALRVDSPPWWQAQFVGKCSAELVLAKSKADGSVQAVTGATVSSRAVTESVKSAIVKVEKAVGGFTPAAGK